MSYDIYWRLKLVMKKELYTNPNFTESHHKNLTRHTLKTGFEYAVDKYRKEYPMWAGTLDYYLKSEHSKKNIEEYYWIQENHNWNWFHDDVAPDIMQ